MVTIVFDTELKRNVYQALQLKSALKLYAATGGRIVVTRGATPRRLLDAAARITGAKKYANSDKGRAQCVADLESYLEGKSLAPSPSIEGEGG